MKLEAEKELTKYNFVIRITENPTHCQSSTCHHHDVFVELTLEKLRLLVSLNIDTVVITERFTHLLVTVLSLVCSERTRVSKTLHLLTLHLLTFCVVPLYAVIATHQIIYNNYK